MDRVEPLERESLLAAMQTRERFLSGILGGLESFVTVDEGWRITFANAAALRFAGLAAAELIGSDLRELARAACIIFDLAALEQAMAERKTTECEAATAGREQVFHCTAYPLADGGLALYARDVTEREREREAKRATDDLYRELVQGVNSVVVRWNREGKFTFFNDYAERLFGWRSEEVVGKPVTIILPDAGEEDLSHLADAILADPEQYATHVNENVSRDGRRLWMAWTNRGLRDEQGNVTEVLGTASDITELVRAQRARREKEIFLDGVLGSFTDAFHTVDSEWRYTFANEASAQAFGVPIADALGKNMWELYPDAVGNEAWVALHKAMEERVTVDFGVRYPASGPWYSARAYPMADGGLAIHVRDRSEEQRIAEELARREEEAQFMVRHAATGIYEIDFRGPRFVSVNDYMCAYSGYTREELLAIDPMDLLDEESRGRFRERVEHALAGEAVVPQVEYCFTTKQGEKRWAVLNVTLTYEDGQPVGAFVVGQDVTERKQAEEALAESERRYRGIVETAEEGIAIHDADGTITFVNERMAEMLGYAREEMTGRSSLDFVDEVERTKVIAAREEEAGSFVAERRMRRKDGSVLWALSHVSPRRDSLGNLLGYLVMHTDITERKRTEEALRESEERLQIATEATGLGVHDYDVRTGRIEWDERLRAMWGLTLDEPVTYETFIGGIHPDDRGRIQAAMDAALDPAGERRFSETYRVISRDGTRRWVSASGHVLFEGGEAVRLVGTAEDVTSRLEIQEALRESEERYRRIVDLADEDLTVSTDGTYSFQESVEDATDGRSRFKRWLPAFATQARHHRMLVLPAAIAFEFVFLVSLGLTTTSRHVLGLPGSLMALTVVVASVLAGWQVGLVAALAGGLIFWGTVADYGADSAAGTVVLSTLVWVAAALLAGFLTDSLTEQVRLRKSAAVALARAETQREQEAERAAQEERIRIARDLHDSVTQSLFAATLKAEALTISGEQSPAAAAALEDVRRLSRGALAEMRAMLLELRGDPVGGVPLQQLLRHLVEAAESRASVKVTLSLDGQAALDPAVHEAVYRVAQEALNNIVRHAKAENAWVQVRGQGGLVRLVVGDDGRGFDPTSVGKDHFGIAFMRERAKETGGELVITSSAGEGTVVTADWHES